MTCTIRNTTRCFRVVQLGRWPEVEFHQFRGGDLAAGNKRARAEQTHYSVKRLTRLGHKMIIEPCEASAAKALPEQGGCVSSKIPARTDSRGWSCLPSCPFFCLLNPHRILPSSVRCKT